AHDRDAIERGLAHHRVLRVHGLGERGLAHRAGIDRRVRPGAERGGGPGAFAQSVPGRGECALPGRGGPTDRSLRRARSPGGAARRRRLERCLVVASGVGWAARRSGTLFRAAHRAGNARGAARGFPSLGSRGRFRLSNATESLAPKPGPRGYFLAIAGNIGVGKTELTDRLSRELRWYAYYEPVIHNPYLDAFYADMSRWAFHLQIYFLSERFKAQVTIGESVGAFIQDRTIYEDREIFARTLHEQGDMTRVDFENYTALFDCMVSFLRKPDLILYLKASPETLIERIARRGRESEKSITLDYLSRLGHAYDDWMERATSLCEVKGARPRRGAVAGVAPCLRGSGGGSEAPLPAADRAAARR